MWCRVVLLGGSEGRYPMAERSPSISAICFVGGAGRARTDDDRIMSPLAPPRDRSCPLASQAQPKNGWGLSVETYVGRIVRPRGEAKTLGEGDAGNVNPFAHSETSALKDWAYAAGPSSKVGPAIRTGSRHRTWVGMAYQNPNTFELLV